MRDKLFIMEFSSSEVRAMAQGLHVLIENVDTARYASSALDALAMQSGSVQKDPGHHHVFRKLTAPTEAIGIPSICYVPLP